MDGVFLAQGPWNRHSLTFPSLEDFTFSIKLPGIGASQVHSFLDIGTVHRVLALKLSLRTIFFGFSILCLDLSKQITRKLIALKILSSASW